MKNWKKNTFISILVILIFVIISCDGDNPKKCTCGEKTHLEEGESCNCNLEDCNCVLKINITLNAGSVIVWKEIGVSIDDFNAMVDLLNELVSPETLSPTRISNFKTNFPEVRIKMGTGISHQGNVLSIGCNETGLNIYKYLVTDNNLI